MTAAYAPTIYQGPTWWAVFLLALAGAAAFVLLDRTWSWLANWYWSNLRRNQGLPDATDDTPDDLPRWMPKVPDQPTEVVAGWWHTTHRLHTKDCPHRKTADPLHNVYTLQQAADAADRLGLRACYRCNPLGVAEEIPA